jgi:hypothetical protein
LYRLRRAGVTMRPKGAARGNTHAAGQVRRKIAGQDRRPE